MGSRITGSTYSVKVNQGSNELSYSYEIEPPIAVQDTEGFTARLKDEVKYFDRYGHITNEPQNLEVELHSLTHSTAHTTHGYIEIAASVLRTEYAPHVIGHALLFLLEPYSRTKPAVSIPVAETA